MVFKCLLEHNRAYEFLLECNGIFKFIMEPNRVFKIILERKHERLHHIIHSGGGNQPQGDVANS
jgi:hypothetical protein